MQKYFEIQSSLQPYKLEIAENTLATVLATHSDAIILCDAALKKKYLSHATQPIITLEASEKTKDLDNISTIIQQLKELKATRNHTLIAVGGGVIQDVACFTASIYMRGINWLYFPTTLLGMADSCIGGKSSINAKGIKNIVGNFYAPQHIYIDPQFLNTLSDEQLAAGLCEAVKICFAHPKPEIFTQYLAFQDTTNIISLSLSAKKWFIEIDEFDKKERQLLNFGHTFGHALEAATDFAIPHGIAVGLGMLCALEMANDLYDITPSGKKRIALLQNHTQDLLSKYSMPRFDTQVIEKMVGKFEHDKKHTQEHYTCIIPNAEGMLERRQLPKNSASLDKVAKAFSSLIS